MKFCAFHDDLYPRLCKTKLLEHNVTLSVHMPLMHKTVWFFTRQENSVVSFSFCEMYIHFLNIIAKFLSVLCSTQACLILENMEEMLSFLKCLVILTLSIPILTIS